MDVTSNNKMHDYILTAQQQEQQRKEHLQQRREQGFAAAKMMAVALKQIGATRVVLFGSLLGENFHENSDLDLAVWDLPERLYFRAVAQLQGIAGFEVDLVETQSALPHIAEAIAQGIDL